MNYHLVVAVKLNLDSIFLSADQRGLPGHLYEFGRVRLGVLLIDR